jgi:LacI family transcriptional regulator
MPQSKEVTIYDIARVLKVSPATVSRGLQNHPHTSPKTKKKILATARQMGYRHNQSARNLTSKKSHTIGVIVPALTSHFMFCVVDGIEKVANKEGYNLIISQSSELSAREADSAKSLFNNRVDGLLASLALDSADLSNFDIFFKKNIPVILFDRVIEHSNCTNILINNHKAAYDATTHLIMQGYERIVHLSAPFRQNIYTERLAGYQQALADHNIKFRKEYLIIENMTMEAGAGAANTLLKLKNRPDSVFAADDSCAIGCMIALKKKGIKIPEDIAFVGFNNDPSCKVVEPNLTTIHYSGHEVGEIAARLLINHLNGIASIHETKTVILRHELIVRESSLNPNKGLKPIK